MTRGNSTDAAPAVKLQITPMIDVTFLLLIFFMLLPFKSLDEKLSAHLPTDRGPMITKTLVPPEVQIRVALRHDDRTGITRVKLLDSTVGTGEDAFRILDDRVTRIAREYPEMPGEIDAAENVPHGAVIRCMDSFVRAGVENVRFRGTKPPGRN